MTAPACFGRSSRRGIFDEPVILVTGGEPGGRDVEDHVFWAAGWDRR